MDEPFSRSEKEFPETLERLRRWTIPTSDASDFEFSNGVGSRPEKVRQEKDRQEKDRWIACIRAALGLVLQLADHHRTGHVHGQLNLQNILFDENDRGFQLRLIEPAFHSKASGNSSDLGMAQFLAPEQSGVLKRPIALTTDWYSLGVLIYRMLTGEYPFSATSLNALLLAQTTSDPIPPRIRHSALPSVLSELAMKMIRREPSDRYQTAAGICRDLELILSWLEGDLDKAPEFWGLGQSDLRSQLTQPAFVGRSREIEAFSEMLDELHSGYQRCNLLSGASGMGKSRLLNRLATESLVRQCLTYRAYGIESAQPRPLESMLPFFRELNSLVESKDSVRDHLRKDLGKHQEALQTLLPVLFVGSHLSVSAGPATFAGRRLRLAVLDLFDSLSRLQQDQILLFDNLDRADEVSKGIVLQWVSMNRKGRNGHFSLMATGTPPIAPELDAVFGEPMGSIEPLNETELLGLLGSMTGLFPDGVLKMIAEHCSGNPSIATSMLFGIVESGKATFRDGKWNVRILPQDLIQSRNQSSKLISHRATGLPADGQQLLGAAAVLGKTFHLEEAAKLARLSPAVARSAIDAAAQRQLVWSNANQCDYGFLYDEIQQLFYRGLEDRNRQALHLHAVRMIGMENRDRCFELAYHYDEAGRGEAAIRWSIEAAARAQSQFANEQSLHYLSIAKKWASTILPESLPRIDESLFEAYMATGDYEAAEYAIRSALKSSSDSLDQIRLTGKLGEVAFKKGKMSKAADHFRNGLALSGAYFPDHLLGLIGSLVVQVGIQVFHTLRGRPRHRPRPTAAQRLRWNLYSRLAHTYWFSRGALWTLAAHLRGMNEAEIHEDTPELAKSYSEHAPVCTLLRQFRRGEEYSRRSLEIRKQSNDAWGQGQTLFFAAVVPLAECKFLECIALANEAIEYLEPTGDAWETNMARYQRAAALMRIGRYRDAANEALRVHSSGVEIGDDQAAGISLDILMRTAPATIADATIEEQAAIDRTDAQSHAQTQLALAILRMKQHRWKDAIAILDESIERCRRAGHLNTYISPSYSWRATAWRELTESTSKVDAALYQSRLRQAFQSACKAVQVARKFPADLPHAYRELGRLELMRNRQKRAVRALQRSLTESNRLGCPMEEWATLRMIRELSELGVSLSPLSWVERQERYQELQRECSDSIACLEFVTEERETLSLADRYGMLLVEGRKIVQSLDEPTILREGCAAAQHLLRSQLSLVAIRNHDNGKWTLKRAFHAKSKNEASAIQIDEFGPYLEEVIQQATTQCFEWNSGETSLVGSLIGAPIRVRESLVGCLLVGHSEIANHFGQDETHLTDFIATLLGAALENADGFAELQDLNRTLEQRVAERTAAAEQRAVQLNESLEALQQKEEQLHAAIEVATRASQAKSQFLATMSHEIRTPLNGILGMASLAIQKKPEPLQLGFLEKIQSSGDSLLRLLNDLLDFSKIEAGKMTVESISIDPQRLVREVIDLFAITAFQKGIELVTYFDPTIPVRLIADQTRLRQVVLNLVGNAIKFTSRGFVALRVEAFGHGQELRWRIRVIDSGIGIPKDKQSDIFHAFSQADNSTTRKFGGTGLGLSISTELIRLMEGTITLISDEGKGSEFCIDLPLRIPPEHVDRARLRLPGANFLIIEPVEAARAYLSESLESMGARVVSHGTWSGWDPIDRPDWTWFDAVFAAGSEGQSVLHEAKSHGVPGFIAQSPIDHPLVGLDSIPKPILPENLEKVLHQILVPTPSLAESTSDHDPALQIDASALSSSLRILVAEDGEINQMVLVGLLDLMGHQSVIANTGVEAVKLVDEQSFDLCLMDLDMPEMDGVEATRKIRTLHQSLPIYAMTAHHDPQHAELCRQAGMNGYLTKPINQEELQQLLGGFGRQASPSLRSFPASSS